MNNVTQILERYHVPFVTQHHHVRSGWIGVDCPFCSPGWQKYRLGFEERTNRVNCWQCGLQKGPNVLAMLCRISHAEAVKLWNSLPRTRAEDTAVVYDPDKVLVKPAGIGPLQAAHEKYLSKRGFDPDVLHQLWMVGGIGISSKLQWRIYIPIMDEKGKTVSWTTRTIDDTAERRYHSASEKEEIYPHKHLIYGEHLLRYSVVIVEGPFDAWAIGPGSGCTFGTSYTKEQVMRLAKYPNRVICFDASADAQQRADALAKQLAPFDGLTINIQLETGDDPASADKHELQELREQFLMEY